jgi:hypothetical protein
MQIYDKRLDEIKPYENNPRHNDNAVDAVANSIREFGFKVPIVVDSEGVIVAGHTRYKAAQKLGLQNVPCLVADDLNDEQINAFRLADNKVGELATWDLDTLKVELDNIGEIDMSEFGFSLDDLTEDETYTRKIEPPTYEPTEETAPGIDELCDKSKYNDLVRYIDNADIPQEVADFLRLAATRHIVYDYGRIAEFYAHQPKEIQDLMESSALVIIDYDKAVANGFVKLTNELETLFGGDSDEE